MNSEGCEMTMTKVHVALVRADITKTVTGCRYERFAEASNIC